MDVSAKPSAVTNDLTHEMGIKIGPNLEFDPF
jgi:hypothetical protein